MTPPAPAPSPLGLEPSFGFGDRLGLATPGHLAALRAAGGPIRGVLAQQSIREMERTGRAPEQVMADAAAAAAAEGFEQPWGADADHLKTARDVERTAHAGFILFTLDPSDAVDQRADDYDDAELDRQWAAVRDTAPWDPIYAGRRVALPDGSTLSFPRPAVRRAAVKYGRAVEQALSLAERVRQVCQAAGRPFELELSIDETAQPTSAVEHYIIADQWRRRGPPLSSLAPRLLGDFEKAVDFKGDLRRLEPSLRRHAAIARALGPYKLSLHSGSDKLSMYALLARATNGLFHVKTAGTSYLEALRVVARHSPHDFRRIVRFARSRYEQDRATYHVSATLASVPPPDEIADPRQLEARYLQRWEDVPQPQGFTAPGRQILHCTFGSVLTHPELGPLVRQIVREHAATYREVLIDHFSRHLRALRAGLD